MKRITTMLLVITLAVAIAGCGSSASQQPASQPSASPAASRTELTIFAAASLKSALNEVIEGYASAVPNVRISVNYGGSGTLQTQLEQGASADIYFSAAAKQMDALDKEGLIVTSSRVDLLKNEIVLIVPSGTPVKVGSFNDAATDAVGKIALGDPRSVPAGQYAQDTFTYLKLWDKVTSKATYASDVEQALSWVESGNVDCGVVYKTDALSDNNVKLIAEAPYGSHTPIVYPVAAVKAGTHQNESAAFIKYLTTSVALDVFTKYGFSS